LWLGWETKNPSESASFFPKNLSKTGQNQIKPAHFYKTRNRPVPLDLKVGGQQIIQSSGRPLRVARTNRVEVSGSALFVGFPVFVVEESCAGLFCGSGVNYAERCCTSSIIERWGRTCSSVLIIHVLHVSCTHRRPVLVQLVSCAFNYSPWPDLIWSRTCRPVGIWSK
jgi:hypothetical protein